MSPRHDEARDNPRRSWLGGPSRPRAAELENGKSFQHASKAFTGGLKDSFINARRQSCRVESMGLSNDIGCRCYGIYFYYMGWISALETKFLRAGGLGYLAASCFPKDVVPLRGWWLRQQGPVDSSRFWKRCERSQRPRSRGLLQQQVRSELWTLAAERSWRPGLGPSGRYRDATISRFSGGSICDFKEADPPGRGLLDYSYEPGGRWIRTKEVSASSEPYALPRHRYDGPPKGADACCS